MTIKILCMMVVLCASATTVLAQEETGPSTIPSKLPSGYVAFVKPVLNCECLKKETSSKKTKPVFYLDIPIVPSWDTIEEDRIKNHTIQQAGSIPSWRKTTRSDKWPLPRILFSTRNFRLGAEGGVMKVETSRKMSQANIGFDRSIWFLLVGADGFIGQEMVLEIDKGVNFSADFRRRSIGGRGWLGVKIGDFRKNFAAVRYGEGYIHTEGAALFNIPSVDGLEWLPLYAEEFKTKSLSVEASAQVKIINQSLRLDGVEYKRVIPSPDPSRFGENRFEDLWLTAETEITPFPKLDVLRGVIVLTKDFGDKNKLMFMNDYSTVRFFIRLSFD